MELIKDAFPHLNRELSFIKVENPTPKKLTLEQIKHFNDKGYLSSLPVFTEEQVESIQEYYDQLRERQMRRRARFLFDNGWECRCRGVYDIVMDYTIHDYVEGIVGENILAWHAHFFCKLPNDQRIVSWHQDASYWRLSHSKAVTVWLAVGDSLIENGCMQVIPGSHLHGQIPFRYGEADNNSPMYQTVENAEGYGDPPVNIELKAGQISIHSDLLLHSSPHNNSLKRRCGLAIRYIPPEVRLVDVDQVAKAILCRGRNMSENWTISGRPDPSESWDIGIELNLKN